MLKFFVTVADGWTRNDMPNGAQIHKKTGEILQIQVISSNIKEAEDKALLVALAEKYNGTPLETVELFGIKFLTTSYTAYGKEQALYSAVKNGEQIKLQVSGKNYKENPEIKEMVESIVINV